jgi:hypothetical protein
MSTRPGRLDFRGHLAWLTTPLFRKVWDRESGLLHLRNEGSLFIRLLLIDAVDQDEIHPSR